MLPPCKGEKGVTISALQQVQQVPGYLSEEAVSEVVLLSSKVLARPSPNFPVRLLVTEPLSFNC